MHCSICRQGTTRPGHATVTLTRGETTVVFRDVPAHVCDNCGEEYVAEEVSRRLLQLAEDAVRSGVEVDIRRFVAA
jgi:YgiT-type zinc finger domain-containing protein